MQAEEDKAKAEKERDVAEQHGYDVGIAETEDALRAEVPAVCRAYCTQTWEEALNRARIDASSELRKTRPELKKKEMRLSSTATTWRSGDQGYSTSRGPRRVSHLLHLDLGRSPQSSWDCSFF